MDSRLRDRKGFIFRRVNRIDTDWGEALTPKAVWHIVKAAATRTGIKHLAPHDLRRTCARLCHASGGELDQIQFLLGHASVQTTERYLGCKQNLGSPVNDRFKLRMDVLPRDVKVESAMVKGSTPVETAPCQGIECRHGGREDEQPVEAKRLFQPERTDLV